MEHRPYLLALAYRMLGSRAAAEDMVQDAFARCLNVQATINLPRAYLTRVVTNLCLDELKAARTKRETYEGPWLPEPLLGAAPFGEQFEKADSVSTALMLVLERLSPLERATYLLHAVFDFSHEEIGDVLERDTAAVRQLFARAKAHAEKDTPRFASSPAAHNELLQAFALACASGDIARLLAILHRDVIVLSDGGGKVIAARKPIVGADHCARFLLGIANKGGHGWTHSFELVNGSAGIVARMDQQVVMTLQIAITDDHLRAVYIVLNPDKLRLAV